MMLTPLNLKQRQIYGDKTHRYLHAIGDPRAGKTRGFMEKARHDLLMYPGIEGLITRDTGTSLLKFTYPQFMKILEKRAIEEIRMKPYPVVMLKNGSVLHFVPYDEADISKAGGSEYGFILVDEATRFSREQWDYFDTRLSQRWGIGIGRDGKEFRNEIPHRWLGTTANPAGRGWTWKVYSTEHPLSYLHSDPDYRAWRFYLEDNESNLPADYVKALRDKPEHIRRKILGANEEPMSGLVFSEFNRDLHVCKISNWIPKPHWKVFIGMDHGFKTPTVAVWMAVTEEGFLIFFHEYRQSHKTITENSLAIYDETAYMFNRGMQWPSAGAIDPSTTQVDGKSGSTKNTYQLYWDAGMNRLGLYPAPKQWVRDRVERIRVLLQPDPSKKRHPITGEYREEGWPTIIFTEDCDGVDPINGIKVESGTITEFEEWEIKETHNSRRNASEMPEEKNDHGPDAVSYALTLYYGDGANSPEDPAIVRKRESDPIYRRKVAIEKRLESVTNPIKPQPGYLQGLEN